MNRATEVLDVARIWLWFNVSGVRCGVNKAPSNISAEQRLPICMLLRMVCGRRSGYNFQLHPIEACVIVFALIWSMWCQTWFSCSCSTIINITSYRQSTIHFGTKFPLVGGRCSGMEFYRAYCAFCVDLRDFAARLQSLRQPAVNNNWFPAVAQ